MESVRINSFRVDLDKQPSRRWDNVWTKNADKVRLLNGMMDTEINKEFPWLIRIILFPILFLIIHLYGYFSNDEYVAELKGMAKHGFSFPKLMLINYGYDFLAHCTSVVVVDKKQKKVWHLRNMDWDTQVLRELTVDIDFYRNGEVNYKATMWLGFVGVLTGMRCGNSGSKPVSPKTVSLNYRKQGGWQIQNVLNIFKGCRPCSFAIRDSLDDPAVNLETVQMVAPCYLVQGQETVISVLELGKPAVLSHVSPERHFERRFCDIGEDSCLMKQCDIVTDDYVVLIQTNTDYDVVRVDPVWAAGDELLLDSVERKNLMKAEIEKLIRTYDKFSVNSCLNAMRIEPMFNRQTIYTVVYGFDLESGTTFYESVRHVPFEDRTVTGSR